MVEMLFVFFKCEWWYARYFWMESSTRIRRLRNCKHKEGEKHGKQDVSRCACLGILSRVFKDLLLLDCFTFSTTYEGDLIWRYLLTFSGLDKGNKFSSDFTCLDYLMTLISFCLRQSSRPASV